MTYLAIFMLKKIWITENNDQKNLVEGRPNTYDELSLTSFRRKSKIGIFTFVMSFTKESTAAMAKKDLANRLNISEGEIKENGVTDKDFSDMSLGAPVGGEMSAQMISSGWQIGLSAGGKSYEYRADKYQVRLVGFQGKNYVIES